MICDWPKCSREAGIIEWCQKRVCGKHMITIDSIDPREARRVLNVDPMVVTGFRLVGLTPFMLPKNVFKKQKKKSKPIF